MSRILVSVLILVKVVYLLESSLSGAPRNARQKSAPISPHLGGYRVSTRRMKKSQAWRQIFRIISTIQLKKNLFYFLLNWNDYKYIVAEY